MTPEKCRDQLKCGDVLTCGPMCDDADIAFCDQPKGHAGPHSSTITWEKGDMSDVLVPWSQWISVADAMPEIGQLVAYTASGLVRVMRYATEERDARGNVWKLGMFLLLSEEIAGPQISIRSIPATHWFPLPEIEGL